MRIKMGADRLVFVFPRLGIVVKLAIIHFISAVRPFFEYRWAYLRGYIQWPLESGHSLRRFLFKGLSANWNEFWFFRKTRNPLLQPTWFSFFGFLNIQKYGELCQLPKRGFWMQMYALTDGEAFADSHHFRNSENFGFSDDGKLRMFDYGSRKSHVVIERFGARIREQFNPSDCWVEENGEKEQGRV